jgi:hypothetical protein
MRASKAADRIGVVIHGPEVVDSGKAGMVLDYLDIFGRVTAILGGTMGRVAVIDAGLEGRIDISRRMTPSRSILELQPVSDLVILLNQAKTRETGNEFGRAVAAKVMPEKPLVQVDFGGKFVSELVGEASFLAGLLAEKFGLDIVGNPSTYRESIQLDGDIIRRKLTGVLPGEKISVNGIVVATAKETSVVLSAKCGRIFEVAGGELKQHGVEKLPPIDLKEAIIRSGDIRRTEVAPRISTSAGDSIVLVDHAAEDVFEASIDAGVVITIGDDTTAIAGDVLTRLGIPVIGIVDGDIDQISHRTSVPSGSVIICVRSGCDDIVGSRVKRELFGDGDRIRLNGRRIEELAKIVREIAGDELLRTDFR